RIPSLRERRVFRRVCHHNPAGRPVKLAKLAEGGGFEPPIRFPVYTLSRRAPSTTRPPLRRRPMFAGRAGNILESNENARLQTRVREINASIHPPAIAYRKL